MLHDKILNYFNWLNDRGAFIPDFAEQKPLAQPSEAPEAPSPIDSEEPEACDKAADTKSIAHYQDENLLSKIPEQESKAIETAEEPSTPSVEPMAKPAAEVELAPQVDQLDEHHEVSNEEITEALPSAVPLKGRKILWVDKGMPNGLELQVFTRLCHALDLKDSEFAFIQWELDRDVGEFFDLATELEAAHIICFSKVLSELICDDEAKNVVARWQKTAYAFRVLPAFPLAQMIKDPRCKAYIWNSLKELKLN